MKDKIRSLFFWSGLVIIISTIITYSLALIFKKFDILEKVGSADAWIGFAGSAMGGIITMLVLYFTLKSNDENNRKVYNATLKPYLICKTIEDKNGNTEHYAFRSHSSSILADTPRINCEIHNISNNIANKIRLLDSYPVLNVNDGSETCNNEIESCGIKVDIEFTKDNMFLAPNGTFNFYMYISILENKDGTDKWKISQFESNHIVVFEFTDIINQTYKQAFEFKVKIHYTNISDAPFMISIEDVSNSIPE